LSSFNLFKGSPKRKRGKTFLLSLPKVSPSPTQTSRWFSLEMARGIGSWLSTKATIARCSTSPSLSPTHPFWTDWMLSRNLLRLSRLPAWTQFGMPQAGGTLLSGGVSQHQPPRPSASQTLMASQSRSNSDMCQNPTIGNAKSESTDQSNASTLSRNDKNKWIIFFCSHTWKNSEKNNTSVVSAHFLGKCLLFVLDLTIFSPSDDQWWHYSKQSLSET